jgi:hypothetical protein
MVLAKVRFQMNMLLKGLVIGLVVLISVVAFSVCAEGVGDVCGHSHCAGGDRSQPLRRLARRVVRTLSATFPLGVECFASASRGVFSAVSSLLPASRLAMTVSLRL